MILLCAVIAYFFLLIAFTCNLFVFTFYFYTTTNYMYSRSTILLLQHFILRCLNGISILKRNKLCLACFLSLFLKLLSKSEFAVYLSSFLYHLLLSSIRAFARNAIAAVGLLMRTTPRVHQKSFPRALRDPERCLSEHRDKW